MNRTWYQIAAVLATAPAAVVATGLGQPMPSPGVLPCSYQLTLTPLRALPTVPVRIGASPPLDFVIDSGSEVTALTDLEVAASLNLHTRPAVLGTGMGGVRMPVLIAPDVALRTGDALLYRTGLAVHTMGTPPDSATALGFHGLLGSDLFEHFVVELDPAAGVVLLHEPASFSYRGPGHSLPLQIDRRRPFVRARIMTSEGRSARLRLLVDTGSESQLALIRGSHRHLRVPEEHEQVVAVGVGGEAAASLASVERLTIGDLSLGPVPTAFFHAQSLSSTRTFPKLQGILGNGLLAKFRTIIDYHRRRLILEPL